MLALEFVPTITNCSQAALIGLCISYLLFLIVQVNYPVVCKIASGMHNQERSINKQLNDKERIIAATDNDGLRSIVLKSISSTVADNVLETTINTSFCAKKENSRRNFLSLRF